MPVETIECQIVQAQLGRYLSGESFSSEMVVQLEAHIANCPICRTEVAQRRVSLQLLLGAAGATQAASAPVNDSAHLIELLRKKDPSTKTASTTHAVVEQMESPAVSSPKGPLGKQALAKPLLYAGALAIVLIGMSYLTKGPTSLFGARALPAGASAATAPITKPTETAPITTTISSAAPADEPITESEWDEIGLDGWMPFDASDSVTRSDAYAWASSFSDQVTTDETTVDETPADENTTDENTPSSTTAQDTTALANDGDQPATLKDWELFGMTEILASTPAPATPITRRPSAKKTRPTTRRPSKPTFHSTVKVYDPN